MDVIVDGNRQKIACDCNKLTLKQQSLGVSLPGSDHSIYYGYNNIKEIQVAPCWEAVPEFFNMLQEVLNDLVGKSQTKANPKPSNPGKPNENDSKTSQKPGIKEGKSEIL